MQFKLTCTKADIKRIKAFYAENKRNAFVQERIAKNLKRKTHPISKPILWQRVISCLCTTQQKSGPGSKVRDFLLMRPHPLDFKVCQKKNDLRGFARSQYKRAGLRLIETLADRTKANFRTLEQGLWPEMFSQPKGLRAKGGRQREREVARFIADNLVGMGPKQSRNFLQGGSEPARAAFSGLLWVFSELILAEAADIKKEGLTVSCKTFCTMAGGRLELPTRGL